MMMMMMMMMMNFLALCLSQTTKTHNRDRGKMEILSCTNNITPSLLVVVKGFQKGIANQAPPPPPNLKHVVEQQQQQQQQQLLLHPKKLLLPPLVAAVVAASPIPAAALAQSVDIQRGATLFGQACIGCHAGGGNIIQPGATLFIKDLERNGIVSEDDIYNLTYNGKGRMPGFGERCTPRGQCTFGPRLKEEEIKLLAEFVKLQADQGWPNNGD